MKIRRHLKSRGFIMSPPTREARKIPRVIMPFMDEASGNAAGPPVEIFVPAPDREVRTPVMKLQRQVSGRMRQIAGHDASLAMSGLCDLLNVEPLTRNEIGRAHD